MEKWAIEVILLLCGVILTVFQWLLKKWVENLEKSVGHLQHVQEEIDKEVRVIKETYVPKTDLRDFKEEIMERLVRIENLLLGRH